MSVYVRGWGGANMWKVRYLLLCDDEASERKKWELAEEVEDDKEVLTLQGFRQLRALHMLQEFLRQRGKTCDDGAIEKWSLLRTITCSTWSKWA